MPSLDCSGKRGRTIEELLNNFDSHAEHRFATLRDLLELLRRLLSLYELKVTLHVLEEWAEQPFAASGLLVDRGGLLAAISEHGGQSLCELVGISKTSAKDGRRTSPPSPPIPAPPVNEVDLAEPPRADGFPPMPRQPLAPDPVVLEEPNEFPEDSWPYPKVRLKDPELLNAVLRELTALRSTTEHSNSIVSRMWDTQQQLQADSFMALRHSRTWGEGVDEDGRQSYRKDRSKAHLGHDSTKEEAKKRASNRNASIRQENCFQRIVHHPAFEYAAAALILLHSGLLGLSVQYEATSGNIHPVLSGGQTFLTGLFCVEVSMKVLAERIRYLFGSEWKWNLFDCVILIMVFMEAGIYLVTNNSKGLKGLTHVGEMIRTTRVLRILKFLRLSPTLQVIIGKIMASMSSLAWVSILIFLLLYVAAVCIAHGAHEYLREQQELTGVAAHRLLMDISGASRLLMDVSGAPDATQADIIENFGSVSRCFYSLFQSITGGELWAKFANILFTMHWLYFAVFVMYIALVAFGVLNTVTGIFVDASMMSRQQQREQIMQMEQAICASIEQELRDVFQQTDGDGSGALTYEELEEMMADDKVQMFLKHLKIDATDTKKLFQALDVDGSREIELEEFVGGVMRVKGEATSLDILQVLKKVERIDKLITVMFKGIYHYDGMTPEHPVRDGRRHSDADVRYRPDAQKHFALANDST